MNLFNIEVISKKPKKIYGLPSHTGQITIGDFKEKFVMPLESWTLEEYQTQWQQALRRLNNHSVSCFVTSVQHLKTKYPSMEIWPFFKEGEKIFFHNQLLINETIEGRSLSLSNFNAQTCYQFILPRVADQENKAINDDGERISEWSLDLNDFLNSPIVKQL